MERDIPLPPPRKRVFSRSLPPRSDYFTFDSSLPSSDPPLFSSDDFQSSTLENYQNSSEQQQQLNATTRPSSSASRTWTTTTTRKRQYRGTWWGEEEAEKQRNVTVEKRRRTEFKDKRNLDSGVWLGSDDSVESALSNNSELEPTDYNGRRIVPAPSYGKALAGTAGGQIGAGKQQPVIFRGPIFARSRQVVDCANTSKGTCVDESYQHSQARKIITECLETGLEVIDISHLNMRTIPPGLLRPIAQFTKYPIIAEIDKIPSLSPPNCEQFFSSFEPFLCLFMTNNQLKTLPAEVFELSNLSVLSVRHNELEQIPGSIGNLTKLSELNVAGNQLSYLPFEVVQLLQRKDTYMRQLTVHPNPFVMPDSSNVSEWHCNVASDGVFTQGEGEKGDQATEISPLPSATGMQPTFAHGRIPNPILIAKGNVQFFDAEGRPVDTPEQITNTNTNNNNTPSSTSSFSPASSSSPSLRDIALCAYNRGPQISHLIDPDTFAGPPIILELLKRAEKVRDAGGKKCSGCARSFVITRAQWMEWWDCESYGRNISGRGDDHAAVTDNGPSKALREMMRNMRGMVLKPLPFRREVCCWGCVPGFRHGSGSAG
ncbi:hypothetical protein AJ78_04704 [Emergomyces pasteurianus Ep9510]|uniref:Uncharacterized protein n=1 Tax=Emergomyces pasteurianus Ep9510 TaxID=1447872 RepID=A0A1J9Q497_9EURO|nr:hypothetical protein AJ78_04704 [Emergomyces pasteurianus Ep9510]